MAGGLLILSSVGHLPGGESLLPVLHNIWLHCGLATATLLGPGRAIIVDGWRGLRRNAPNMNTLVGLGTLTAYTSSLLALSFPQLGWECFFDEPVMLLGFICWGGRWSNKPEVVQQQLLGNYWHSNHKLPV
jgi:Cu2+-exporting ATPase